MTENIVVVPDLSAVDLTALVKSELPLEYLGREFAAWDYYRGRDGREIEGRGRKFEFLIWTPDLKRDETIKEEGVLAHFGALGYCGHTGAFVQWWRTCGLEGYYATVPEPNACLYYPPYRHHPECLCVPCALLDRAGNRLGDSTLRDSWDAYSFVGFKLIG